MRWLKSYKIYNEGKEDFKIDENVLNEAVNEFNKYFNVAGVKMDACKFIMKDDVQYKEGTPEHADIEYYNFAVSIDYQEQLLFHHIIEVLFGYPKRVYPDLNLGYNYRAASYHGIRATLGDNSAPHDYKMNFFELRLYQDHMKHIMSTGDSLFNKMVRVINGLICDSDHYNYDYNDTNSGNTPPNKAPFNSILNDILEQYSGSLVNNPNKSTDDFYKITIDAISKLPESHNIINNIKANRNPSLWNKIKSLFNPDELENSATMGGMGFAD